MSIWRIEKAMPEHMPLIAQNMREADRREVWASNRHTPAEALATSLERAELAWTCFVQDVPAFMWGVSSCTLLSNIGIPWLLGTNDIYVIKREFLRQSRNYVQAMQEPFDRLENQVHAGNTLSIRWLQWCGFTVDKEPVYIHGEKLLTFWRE